MSAMKNHLADLDMEADRLLKLVRDDMILIARGDMKWAPSGHLMRVLAHNLKRLADVVGQGGLPDPFPVFRHGEEDTITRDLLEALKLMTQEFSQKFRVKRDFHKMLAMEAAKKAIAKAEDVDADGNELTPEPVAFLESALSCEPNEAVDLLTNYGPAVLDRWYENHPEATRGPEGT